VAQVPRVLNALEVLERLKAHPHSINSAADFLRLIGERGMWVIESPLAAALKASDEDKWAMLARTNRLSQEVADAARDTVAGMTMGDCGNAECGWRGPLSDCSYVGAAGPCCPKCREIVELDAPGVRVDVAGKQEGSGDAS
jgi:hypothetical protein